MVPSAWLAAAARLSHLRKLPGRCPGPSVHPSDKNFYLEPDLGGRGKGACDGVCDRPEGRECGRAATSKGLSLYRTALCGRPLRRDSVNARVNTEKASNTRKTRPNQTPRGPQKDQNAELPRRDPGPLVWGPRWACPGCRRRRGHRGRPDGGQRRSYLRTSQGRCLPGRE